MSLFKNLSIFISLLIAQLLFTEAATFEFHNKCPYTVWPAFSPQGGRQLDRGQLWTINVPEGTPQGRVWARTNCTFDSSGRGKCQTGDCNGLLQCKAYGGDPPNTLVEYTLNQSGNDFFDMSLVDGFNVPIEFSPTSNECTRSISCIADIEGQCPNDLRTPGGCNNPCTVFKTTQYCCISGSCGPTIHSRFFKQSCPDAYSYPMDDQNTILTCPGGTNYKVVFCPDTNPIAQLATEFDIRNNCPFTVWAAAVPGGGQRLDYGGTWRINASRGVRIWGRTNCNFDISTGRGHCQTGDCNGLLQCQTFGNPPNTLAEYSLNKFQISLSNGFNIPMKVIPTLTDGCSDDSISCTADITGQCPKELRTPGGCNDPCTVFNTGDCCTSGNCGEIDYSRFFNERCPNSLSYPRDAATTNNLICPSTTTNYRVVFCP